MSRSPGFGRKNARPVIAAGIALVVAAASASATALTFSDTVNPDPDRLIAFGSNISYSFTHSIVADQDPAGTFWTGVYGYNPLTDSITSASVVLEFKDESSDAAAESVELVFDGQSFGTSTITSGGATYTASVTSGFGTLLSDGILNVTLKNAGTTSGQQYLRSDFLFLDSTLTVEVDGRRPRTAAALSVPEPATLALLGLGLAAVAASRGRRVD